MTLALAESGHVPLVDFQQAFGALIADAERKEDAQGRTDYYTLWLTALERVVDSALHLRDDALASMGRRIVASAAETRHHQHLASRDAAGQLVLEPVRVDSPHGGTAA